MHGDGCNYKEFIQTCPEPCIVVVQTNRAIETLKNAGLDFKTRETATNTFLEKYTQFSTLSEDIPVICDPLTVLTAPYFVTLMLQIHSNMLFRSSNKQVLSNMRCSMANSILILDSDSQTNMSIFEAAQICLLLVSYGVHMPRLFLQRSGPPKQVQFFPETMPPAMYISVGSSRQVHYNAEYRRTIKLNSERISPDSLVIGPRIAEYKKYPNYVEVGRELDKPEFFNATSVVLDARKTLFSGVEIIMTDDDIQRTLSFYPDATCKVYRINTNNSGGITTEKLLSTYNKLKTRIATLASYSVQPGLFYGNVSIVAETVKELSHNVSAIRYNNVPALAMLSPADLFVANSEIPAEMIRWLNNYYTNGRQQLLPMFQLIAILIDYEPIVDTAITLAEQLDYVNKYIVEFESTAAVPERIKQYCAYNELKEDVFSKIIIRVDKYWRYCPYTGQKLGHYDPALFIEILKYGNVLGLRHAVRTNESRSGMSTCYIDEYKKTYYLNSKIYPTELYILSANFETGEILMYISND